MKQVDLSGRSMDQEMLVNAEEALDELPETNGMQVDERSSGNLTEREARLIKHEREVMQREIDLLKIENEMLRAAQQQSDASSSSFPHISVGIENVSNLLSEYNGSGEDFERWKAQVNLLKEIYNLDDNLAKVMVVSKLRDKVFRWYHSKTEHLEISVEELLNQMESVFNERPGRLALRRKFQSREWKYGESFSEYCHYKLILGNQVPISNDEIVDYVIDGIPEEYLKSQARMQSFSSVNDILKAFKEIQLSAPKLAEVKQKHPPPKGSSYKLQNELQPQVTSMMSDQQTAAILDNARQLVKNYRYTNADVKNHPVTLQVGSIRNAVDQAGGRCLDEENSKDCSEDELMDLLNPCSETENVFEKINDMDIQELAPCSHWSGQNTKCSTNLIKDKYPTNDKREAEAGGSRMPPPPPPPPQRIYYSYFHPQNNVFEDQDRDGDQNQYLMEAKRLKCSADDECEFTAQCMQYLEAGLYFLLSGHAMESDSRNGQAAFTMYKDTLSLIKYISSKLKNKLDNSPESSIHTKLAVLSLWCQSLLYYKLLKMRERDVKENQKILADYHRKLVQPNVVQPAGRHMPSPLSPTLSPAGSISSVDSRSSGYDSGELTNRDAVPGQVQGDPYVSVPLTIYNAMQKQNQHFSLLMSCHELWEQANSLVTDVHRDFFIELDEQRGPLTLKSSLHGLVRYVQAGIRMLGALGPE